MRRGATGGPAPTGAATWFVLERNIMASLFKPKFKRYRDAAGRPCKKDTPGAVSTKYEADKWYGRYFDQDGIKRAIPLAADKSAAQQMLADKIKEVERRKAGLIDHYTDHAREPIEVHLRAYEAYLQSTGTEPDGVRDTLRYCRMMPPRISLS
jgi:hypothetical protein